MIHTYAQAWERLRTAKEMVRELPRWEELTERERLWFTFAPDMHVAFDAIAAERMGVKA